MPRQKSVDEVVDKAAKRNIFPNITTAYAVLESTNSISSDTSTTIIENNKKAP